MRRVRHQTDHDVDVVVVMLEASCELVVVGVEEGGVVVERGTPHKLFTQAEHPYTQALLAAVPRAEPSAVAPAQPASGTVAGN